MHLSAQMVGVVTEAATAAVTITASSKAVGWLRRKMGLAAFASLREGSLSMKNWLEMTKRMRAQTRPSCCIMWRQ